ncbi:MAG: Fur family transcriptional regulator [Bacillota bacterium]
MKNFTDLIALLKEKEIRCTNQRKAILKVLYQIDRPLSAQEILNQLKSKHPKLRLSTIYRNLNLFEVNNLINRLNFTDQETKFELLTDKHHHHLICQVCGEITPLDCPLNNFEEELSSKTDYTILDHKIKVYGICPHCKKEQS